jgi:hypothetical protein
MFMLPSRFLWWIPETKQGPFDLLDGDALHDLKNMIGQVDQDNAISPNSVEQSHK